MMTTAQRKERVDEISKQLAELAQAEPWTAETFEKWRELAKERRSLLTE